MNKKKIMFYDILIAFLVAYVTYYYEIPKQRLNELLERITRIVSNVYKKGK